MVANINLTFLRIPEHYDLGQLLHKNVVTAEKNEKTKRNIYSDTLEEIEKPMKWR